MHEAERDNALRVANNPNENVDIALLYPQESHPLK